MFIQVMEIKKKILIFEKLKEIFRKMKKKIFWSKNENPLLSK